MDSVPLMASVEIYCYFRKLASHLRAIVWFYPLTEKPAIRHDDCEAAQEPSLPSRASRFSSTARKTSQDSCRGRQRYSSAGELSTQ